MTRSRVISAAIGWNFGSLAIQTLVQLGYTATTSRLLSPTDFGAYAATLSMSVLISIAFGSGLSASVQTAGSLDRGECRDALTWGLRLGVAAAATALALAYPWALIWNVPDSVSTSSLAAAGLLVQPLSLVLLAVARRNGVHGVATGVQLAASLGAMALGLAAVVASQSLWAIMVMPIALTWLTVLMLAVRLRLWPIQIVARNGLTGFARKTTILSLVNYWSYWPVPWAVGRYLGPSALGEWSRAQLLAGLPTERVTSASTTILFPEYRRVPPAQLPSAATDSVIMVGTTVVTGLAVLAGSSTPIVRVVLGDQWPETARILPLLSLAFAFQGLLVPLASYLQQRGTFRQLYLAQGLGGAVGWTGALLLAIWSSLVFAGLAFALGLGVTLTMLVYNASRSGAIDGPRLAHHLVQLGIATGPLWGLGALQSIGAVDPSTMAEQMGVLLAAVTYGLAASYFLYRQVVRPLLASRGVLPWDPASAT